MEAKHILRSRTFWFNLVVLATTVLAALGYGELARAMEVLAALLGLSGQAVPEIAGIATGLVAVVNLLLRLRTRQGVRLR